MTDRRRALLFTALAFRRLDGYDLFLTSDENGWRPPSSRASTSCGRGSGSYRLMLLPLL